MGGRAGRARDVEHWRVCRFEEPNLQSHASSRYYLPYSCGSLRLGTTSGSATKRQDTSGLTLGLAKELGDTRAERGQRGTLEGDRKRHWQPEGIRNPAGDFRCHQRIHAMERQEIVGCEGPLRWGQRLQNDVTNAICC